MPADGTELSAGGLLGAMPDWLAAGADPDLVGDALRTGVPELAGGDWVLHQCKPKLRLKDDDRWEAAYRLTLTDPHGQERHLRLIGDYRPRRDAAGGPAVGRGDLGDADWAVEIPSLGLTLEVQPEDEGLPALPELTEPARARRLLQESLNLSWPDVRIERCHPEVMRYKPGSRCTVRYQLDYAPGSSGPATLVAKTYRGDKGANAYAGMAALDRAGIPAATVTLAPALAYFPDLRVLVQGAVAEEQTLKEVALRSGADGSPAVYQRLRDEVAKVAAGLAAFHRSGVDHGDSVVWEDELDAVRELMARLGEAVPEVAGRAEPFVDGLVAVASATPADRAGPAHGSFRPAQVLLAGGEIAFIDFDGLCSAEPAMDVALFRAALRDAGMRGAPMDDPAVVESRLTALDEVCDHFLDRYLVDHPISRTRVSLWESLYTLKFALRAWTKVQPRRVAARAATLERHMASLPR
jgi:hypothetical protein